MKIGIIGITGRMGSVLSKIIPNAEKNGGSSSKTSREELVEIISNSDVLIDFSVPSSLLEAVTVAAKYKVPVISGTTGLSENDFKQIREFSYIIPILHANNFSLGIHLMAVLIKKCADVLTDFDFSIIDKHHNRKKDSPSGTALFLAKQTTQKAQIVSLREGNIFGQHICDFAGENEILSISHEAFNLEVFASGALKCAYWIVKKNPNLYTIADYLK
ncbi:MAG: 4-hydroxy-tetrahydrodipicolinate reductase [Holosporaceae bacterium]|jgi:4-hydroxy-tetrahydrodipicolinate reductase|nr:4-hydroxy-tetrahydrodipicolinate reductase [Holosporaceae bacterium]